MFVEERLDKIEGGIASLLELTSIISHQSCLEKLAQIESLLTSLIGMRTIRDWYTTAQAANLLEVSEHSVRQWCRTGRIRAERRLDGRGMHKAWVINHEEITRYQREGLLPVTCL